MSSLTRKHFNQLADVAGRMPIDSEAFALLVRTLADICEQEDPRFDRELFESTCSYNRSKSHMIVQGMCEEEWAIRFELADDGSPASREAWEALKAIREANTETDPRAIDALKEIATFSDSEDQMDEIVAFRWHAVTLAREALASLKTGGA